MEKLFYCHTFEGSVYIASVGNWWCQKINRELYTKLHPYYIRQHLKYIELQETLMAVTNAVSSIANLAIEANTNWLTQSKW